MAFNVPKTLARPNYVFNLAWAVYDPDYKNATHNITIPADSWQAVGSVQSIKVDMKRESKLWRAAPNSYSNDNSWVGKEVVPGLPAYELTLDKVLLHYVKNAVDNQYYPDSWVSAFGMVDHNEGFDIVAQYRPVAIKVGLPSPAATNVATADTTLSLVFYSCWFESFPLDLTVEKDNDTMLIQSTKVKSAFVNVSKA